MEDEDEEGRGGGMGDTDVLGVSSYMASSSSRSAKVDKDPVGEYEYEQVASSSSLLPLQPAGHDSALLLLSKLLLSTSGFSFLHASLVLNVPNADGCTPFKSVFSVDGSTCLGSTLSNGASTGLLWYASLSSVDVDVPRDLPFLLLPISG